MDELMTEDSVGGAGGESSGGGSGGRTRARSNGDAAAAAARGTRPPSSDENAMPPPAARRSTEGGGGGGGGEGASKRGRGTAAAAATAFSDDDEEEEEEEEEDSEGEPSARSDDRECDARNTSDLEGHPSDGGVEVERRDEGRGRRRTSNGERGRRAGGSGAAAAAAAALRGRGRPPSNNNNNNAGRSAAAASRALDAAAEDAQLVRAAARRLEEAEAREAANDNANDNGENDGNGGQQRNLEALDVDASGRPFVVVGADGREWHRPRGQGLPGQVKTVVLRDFMCHEHFKVELCPHVNFVSGVNGSGKSALLQALQLALGVRAAATGRASAASSLVRTGASQASIRVEIWNTGPDAHRPELFGDTVVIERKLSATSAHSLFSLKTKAGKVVSNTKREVDAVLEALSVDAANPVVVMTQDVARSFLGGGGGGGGGNAAAPDRGIGATAASAKKFEVYMKATLLARAESSHAAAADAVAETRRHVEAEAERLAERNAKVAALQKSLNSLGAAERCREEVGRCDRALAWATARNCEAVSAAVELRLTQKGPEMLRAAQERLSRLEEAAGEAQRSADEQGARSESAVAALNDATKLHRAAVAEAAAAERAKGAAKRAAEGALEREAAAQASCEAAFAAAEAAADAASKARIQRAKAAMGRAAAEEKKVGAALKARSDSMAEAKTAVFAKGERSDSANMALQTALDNAKRSRSKHEELAAAQASKNRAAFFGGTAAVGVAGEVARQLSGRGPSSGGSRTRLSGQGPCAGPLGALVALTEPRWAAALQAAAGPGGSHFLTSTAADADTLIRLFADFGLKSGARAVLVDSAIPPHRVEPLVDSRGGPLKTLLSVLDFSSSSGSSSSSASAASAEASAFAATAARNYLIDAFKVERVVLCESEAEARSAARLKGVVAAVLPDGTSFTFKGGTLTGRPSAASGGGGGKSGWIGLYGGAAAAEEAAEEASRAEKAASESKRKHKAKLLEFEEAKEAYKAAVAGHRGAKQRHDAARAALTRAEDELSAAAGGGGGGIAGGGGPTSSSLNSNDSATNFGNNAIGALEEALRQARAEAADRQRALDEAEAALSAATLAAEEAAAGKDRLAAALSNEAGTGGLQALLDAAGALQRKAGAARDAVARIEEQLARLEGSRDRIAAEAAARRGDASAVCSEGEGEEALRELAAIGAFEGKVEKALLVGVGLLEAPEEEAGGEEAGAGAEQQGGEGEESDGGGEGDEGEEGEEEGGRRNNNNRRRASNATNAATTRQPSAAKVANLYEALAAVVSARRDRARQGAAAARAEAGGDEAELRAELAAAKPACVASAAKLRTHAGALRALEESLQFRMEDFKRMDRQVEEAVRIRRRKSWSMNIF